MPVPPLRFDTSIDSLRPAFDEIRRDLDISVEFDADVVAEAEAVAASGPFIEADVDRRDIELLTIDPAGARDLDQAVSIERDGDGFVVHYAIADVAAFVRPGGAIDRAARQRAVTVYLPDRRAPLHPTVLSEGAASLLPGEDRQALLWTFGLDGSGTVTRASLERARVRSRKAYAYDEAQRDLDAGRAPETIALLAQVGPLREALEAARGGVDLGIPEQVVADHDGRYVLEYRAPLPLENWNAQISLMTGMVAAQLMLDAAVGVLRTLPLPPDGDVEVLRRHARALRVPWEPDASYRDFIRSLDATVPDHAALLAQAGRLFRGAGYAPFDLARGIPLPTDHEHAAVAAPYAHVTAPLRRLVDRFGNEIALAACAGADPPEWARDALPELADRMAAGRQREGAADGQAADLVEAVVLSGCIGEVLEGVVVRVHRKGAQVQIRNPAVVANVDGDGAGLGDEVHVRVVATDPSQRRVELALVS